MLASFVEFCPAISIVMRNGYLKVTVNIRQKGKPLCLSGLLVLSHTLIG
jgi:hypothetical protein